MSAPAGDGRVPPRLAAGGPLDHARLPAVLAGAVASGAPGYLPGQRWYGDKTRRIDGVALRDVGLAGSGPDTHALVVTTVTFGDGGSADYFLPLTVTLEPARPDQTLAVLAAGSDEWRLVDALALPRFHAWLLDQLAAGATVDGRSRRFAFRPGGAIGNYLGAARTGEARVASGEQSNTSVIFGDAAIMKVFRKLQPGLNPDLEIGRFLTERTDFRHIPALLGSVEHAGGDTDDSLGMLQAFVPSRGDAWTLTLAELARVAAAGGDGASDDSPEGPDTNLLGRRTGQLHVALASADDDPAFAPEPASAVDAAAWHAATADAAARRATELAGLRARLPARTAEQLDRLRLGGDAVGARVAGYRHLVGLATTRVHGDYHLGQVLRTLDGDVVLLDFEGEPARPVAERRRKRPPLVDVAGMLRSFRYARAAAEKGLPGEAPPQANARLAAWERRARDAFVAGYRAEVAVSPVPLVPADPAAFEAALAAWEFDKAVYELGYELNNRPDWLDIPIATLGEADG